MTTTRQQAAAAAAAVTTATGREEEKELLDDEDGLRRGETRSRAAFRRTSRGNYASLASLKKAHQRIFTLEPLFVMSENPVAERKTGIAQGVLRVSYRSLNKKSWLVKAYQRMERQYPGSVFYVTLTCNVVLRHAKENTFQVFYGQSFGRARTVYLGQKVDASSGDLERLFLEFPVSSVQQASELPTDWSLADFQELYRQHFDHSNVEVHEIISLIYFFSKGLDDYEREHTLPRQPEVVSLAR